MQTIKYKFADGTTNEVEVTEEIYLIHLELLQQEKRNHWKETRRHTSLYYYTDKKSVLSGNVVSRYRKRKMVIEIGNIATYENNI